MGEGRNGSYIVGNTAVVPTESGVLSAYATYNRPATFTITDGRYYLVVTTGDNAAWGNGGRCYYIENLQITTEKAQSHGTSAASIVNFTISASDQTLTVKPAQSGWGLVVFLIPLDE